METEVDLTKFYNVQPSERCFTISDVGKDPARYAVLMNLLPTLTLALLLIELTVWPQPAHGDDTASTSGIGTARPIKYVDTLAVNISNSQRYITDNTCESEGIQTIRKLASTSGYEEMWAYLPRAQPLQRCQWHEIGRGETSTEHDAYVSVDRAYLEKLMATHKEIAIYHFHPLTYFQCAASNDCDHRSVPADGDDTSIKKLISDLRFSMPSPNDIHFMMDTTWQFNQHHARGAWIVHKVVSPYGVASYTLTEDGRMKYGSDKDSRTQGLYIKWVAASALADEGIEPMVKDYEIHVAIRHLVQSLNTKYLQVDFSPFKPGFE